MVSQDHQAEDLPRTVCQDRCSVWPTRSPNIGDRPSASTEHEAGSTGSPDFARATPTAPARRPERPRYTFSISKMSEAPVLHAYFSKNRLFCPVVESTWTLNVSLPDGRE